jgi:uncharacterized protein YecA (UPF0149 family)
MARYQGAYREDADDTQTLSEEQTVNENHQTSEPEGEESTFKKRYGDLRRHMQQTLAQKDQEMAQIREQLDKATRQQIKFPKTEEEVAAWSKKYPDVAKIVDTIAQKRVQEALAIGEKKLAKIGELEQRIAKEKAEAELRSFHPDFDNIRADRAFHDWVEAQPQWVQDSLYKNSTDAKAAARAIDLYKADKGIKKKRQTSNSEAARSVGRSSGSAPSTGRSRFTESQVAKMTPKEYEKNEDAILDSIRQGTFEYDLTGGAR